MQEESVEALHREVVDLRASRARLVRAADADHRALERSLHNGLQQDLTALAVKLQLARQVVGADPAAATLLQELDRDVQQALDAAARLAQRIYVPLLETGGLAVSLRAAAAGAGLATSIDVLADGDYPAEIVRTVYLCCLAALEHIEEPAAITVRDEEGALAFEVRGEGRGSPTADPQRLFEALRDRVEALSGRLAVEPGPSGRLSVSGSLPLSR